MWGYGTYGGWGLAMGLMMLVVWAGIFYVVWSALRTRPDVSDARRILDERLARGEIDAVEYRERLAALAAGSR